mmetsp:Transcript_26284/g.66154  ORF Transcript_26284/g.66154 Transcript_26284/m.66154 type:complete len:92 (+) Transcript_26284:93-368(+)
MPRRGGRRPTDYPSDTAPRPAAESAASARELTRWRDDAAGGAALQQCAAIERRAFGKADSWAGGLFELELRKRTVRLLYLADGGGQVRAAC